jgi:hypothetical protein
VLLFQWEPSSSVSIVSDYGLDDRVIGVRSPAGAKDFSSNLCIQTGSEAHPASCTMGTGRPFLGAKRSQGVMLTTHPHLVPSSKMSRSYTSSPPSATMACSRSALLFIISMQVITPLYLHFERKQTSRDGRYSWQCCVIGDGHGSNHEERKVPSISELLKYWWLKYGCPCILQHKGLSPLKIFQPLETTSNIPWL